MLSESRAEVYGMPKCLNFLGASLALFAWAAGSGAEPLTVERTGDTLVVRDGGAAVLTYRAGLVPPPVGLDAERLSRSSYIHPLIGLHGEAITEDFPPDHYHQRGVFWAWPEGRIGARKMDAWTLDGARQHFGRWLDIKADGVAARFGVENVWCFDGEVDPKVRETVRIAVSPVEDNRRAIDFELTFENVSDEAFTLEGAKGKGYGGLCFRPDAAHKPLTFVTREGVQPEDLLRAETPWAAVFWTRSDTGAREGVALFQHPTNPDYPHPGWVLRHYGLLGAAWPHEEPRTYPPGEGFTLRYRLVVYGAEPDAAAIAADYAAYVDAEK
jgi:hypothetical protein